MPGCPQIKKSITLFSKAVNQGYMIPGPNVISKLTDTLVIATALTRATAARQQEAMNNFKVISKGQSMSKSAEPKTVVKNEWLEQK
ncbi:hypothetical protein MRB53_018185 [Persea americana]|uniref:Uncharacterized protein n=1 Tax=Persea americana TaxID=3435 RepID=A0ACC2M788_PERAE|nr:hypothetical protein MRB53_018185 [Persea americana]